MKRLLGQVHLASYQDWGFTIIFVASIINFNRSFREVFHLKFTIVGVVESKTLVEITFQKQDIYQDQDCSKIKAVPILIEFRILWVIPQESQWGFNNLESMKKIKTIVDLIGLNRSGGDIILDYNHLQTPHQGGIFIVEQKEVEA